MGRQPPGGFLGLGTVYKDTTCVGHGFPCAFPPHPTHNTNSLKTSLTFQKSDSQDRTDTTPVWGASWPHCSQSTC